MNPFDVMKNLQNLQQQMTEMQVRLKQVQVTGSAGGDMVQVEINGHFEILKVRVSPEVVDVRDIAMLEDLIKAAFTDAMTKIKERIRDDMGAAGLGMPGLT